MSPDTQTEMLHVNVKIVGAIISILAFAVGGIGWGARLEYYTEANREAARALVMDMNIIRSDRARDNDRITRAESQLTFILEGISEIKTLIKERDKKP